MKIASKLLLSLFGLVSLSATMFAGAESVLNMQVPFAFVAGGKLLPAGNYRVTEFAETGLVMINSGTTATSMALITIPGEMAPVDAERGLKFERRNGTVYLHKVVLEGREARIVKELPVETGAVANLGGGK